jgi:hypothetical protein
LILSVPDIDGRFYGMPTLDAWTNVFVTIGARITGTEALITLLSAVLIGRVNFRMM